MIGCLWCQAPIAVDGESISALCRECSSEAAEDAAYEAAVDAAYWAAEAYTLPF